MPVEAKILTQVDTYGCTTVPIAARCFCDSDEKQAASSLKNLVVKKTLKRCRFDPLFYVRYERYDEHKDEKRQIRDDWQILRFCLDENTERFSKDSFFELLGPVIEQTGHALKYVPAYAYQETLSLIRIHHPKKKGTVQGARHDLETFVNLPQFAVWAMLAQQKMFTLTYLVPEGWAEELTRWLSLDPLTSTLGAPPIEIPVRVGETENLTPRKDKSPEAGLLSSPLQSKGGSPIKKPPAYAVGAADL